MANRDSKLLIHVERVVYEEVIRLVSESDDIDSISQYGRKLFIDDLHKRNYLKENQHDEK